MNLSCQLRQTVNATFNSFPKLFRLKFQNLMEIKNQKKKQFPTNKGTSKPKYTKKKFF